MIRDKRTFTEIQQQILNGHNFEALLERFNQEGRDNYYEEVNSVLEELVTLQKKDNQLKNMG
jgi:hypothetical protein